MAENLAFIDALRFCLVCKRIIVPPTSAVRATALERRWGWPDVLPFLWRPADFLRDPWLRWRPTRTSGTAHRECVGGGAWRIDPPSTPQSA